MYHDKVEYVKDSKGLEWMKIAVDDAFLDVVKGWYEGEDVYLSSVRSFDVAIQAGGYCGVYPRFLGEKFSTVYTFEPDPLNFYCLVNNCQNDNVVKSQMGLGNYDADPVMIRRLVNTNRGMISLVPSEQGWLPVTAIDDMQLTACDLIMLDVEGTELDILEGAWNTITKYAPVITVEDTSPEIERYLSNFSSDLGKYTNVGTIYRDTVYAVK